MPRLELDTAAGAGEVRAFAERVARAPSALRGLAEARPGTTPRSCVWQRDAVRLYRYGAQRESAGEPLLIVYALVNRPEMADLESGRSLVAGLVERGRDVYLLDWGYPGAADAGLGLADYLGRYLDGAVDYLRGELGRARLPLLGICQGGTFALCYAALHPDKVERLVLSVTPVDFHTPDDALSHLARHIDVEALVAAHGNLAGDWLNALFLALKPYQLLQQKYLRFLDHVDDRAASATFLRMEHWIFDSPALAARMTREFAVEFYQRNALVAGTLAIAGHPVRLAAVTMPVLNIYARDDHLVPPAASRALAALVGTRDYCEHELAGGHIGIYVGSRAARPVAAVVAEWLGTAVGAAGER
ncbi:MAG: class III poly(R)-hydroxyalkanoic acid synthase subunit PhaC [Gammaproteobacteria bacterium]|nr:class III poly(R)-hydroxyalkanoic acid synthase subunit PhaC [Gammaproteobacteria bacterium]MCP5201825.1 class III poly(R)-hydroxyalkanoic acid synthase subunit PhaC [Gammaproteobacteria bacterium]